jgi:hypothetical protein
MAGAGSRASMLNRPGQCRRRLWRREMKL